MKEPNYHTTNFFSESLLATEIKKKHGYLQINLSIILEICMSFGIIFVKPRYGKKNKTNNEIMLHGYAQLYSLLKNGRETFIPTFQKMSKQDLMLQI